jgi:AraC-like DNA-binding protein
VDLAQARRLEGARPLVLTGLGAIPLAWHVQALEAEAAENGQNTGLRMGVRLGLPGLLGRIAGAAPTLGLAIAAVCELYTARQQATEMTLSGEGQLRSLGYRILDGSILGRRQDSERAVGQMLHLCRRALGRFWSPCEVSFEHPTPAALGDHAAIFAAPLYFGRPANALVLQASLLNQLMPAADPRLFARLRAEFASAGLQPATVDLADLARGHIRALLPEGPPRIQALTDAMGLERWTLQRRLAKSGVSFSGLVDCVRRDLARLYVEQPHVPVADIAELLGFSELSAFSRAFTRWFAVCPRQYRARFAVGAPAAAIDAAKISASFW